MMNLKGKTVFVTGASSGIGEATALEFAKLGTRVMICARRMEKLDALLPRLKYAGAEDVHAFELDVRDRAAVKSAIEALPEPWREIDVLVNNAGLSRGLTKQYEDDIDNWDEMIDTNIKGLLYVSRAVVPGMVARNRGHVINLGSIAGHWVYPNGSVYCATKSAEAALTEGLRIDINGTALRVTTVDPGMVETEFSEVRYRGDSEKAAKVYEGIDALTAEDIAETIVWAATRPKHVMIQEVIITPTMQASPFSTTRKKL